MQKHHSHSRAPTYMLACVCCPPNMSDYWTTSSRTIAQRRATTMTTTTTTMTSGVSVQIAGASLASAGGRTECGGHPVVRSSPPDVNYNYMVQVGIVCKTCNCLLIACGGTRARACRDGRPSKPMSRSRSRSSLLATRKIMAGQNNSTVH